MLPKIAVVCVLLSFLLCVGLNPIQAAPAASTARQDGPGQHSARESNVAVTPPPAATPSPFPSPTSVDSALSGYTTYQDPYNSFFVSIPEYGRKRPGDRPAIFQLHDHSTLMFFEKSYLAPPTKDNLEDLANGILYVRLIQENLADHFEINQAKQQKDDYLVNADYSKGGVQQGEARLVLKTVSNLVLGILLVTSDFSEVSTDWDTVLRTYKLVASISTPLPASSDLLPLTTSSGGLKTLPDEVRDLFSVPQGEYLQVEDFDQSLAQNGGFKAFGTDRYPSDFVLRAQVSWWNAAGSVSWNKAGCGFIFRYIDKKNYYSLNWALDGNAYFQRVSKGETNNIFYGYFTGRNQSHGEGTLLMSVSGSQVATFFNGKRVYRAVDPPLTGSMKSGDIGLAVFSGTNADFGTRCKMTKVELWEVKRP